MFLFLLILNFFLSITVCSNDLKSSLTYLDESNLRNLEDEKQPIPFSGNFSCNVNSTKGTADFLCPTTDKNYTCEKKEADKDGYMYNCMCIKQLASDLNEERACTFERKRQLTSFLLELFVGFGAGHFYRANYLEASLKLVAFLFGIYIICLFPLTAKCVADCCECDCLVVLVSLFWFLISAGLAFWFIFDLVWFGKNKYHDKYGFCLMEWGKKDYNSGSCIDKANN